MMGVQLPIPPPTHQVPASTFSGHGKLLLGWERTQDQRQVGRMIQQDGWHMPTALEPLPGYQGRVGPTSSSLLPSWAISSTFQKAGELGLMAEVGEFPAGLWPGPQATAIPFHSCFKATLLHGLSDLISEA